VGAPARTEPIASRKTVRCCASTNPARWWGADCRLHLCASIPALHRHGVSGGQTSNPASKPVSHQQAVGGSLVSTYEGQLCGSSTTICSSKTTNFSWWFFSFNLRGQLCGSPTTICSSKTTNFSWWFFSFNLRGNSAEALRQFAAQRPPTSVGGSLVSTFEGNSAEALRQFACQASQFS
jgi:hypothetical protein